MRGFLWDPPGSLHITTLNGSLILLGGLIPPDPPIFRTLLLVMVCRHCSCAFYKLTFFIYFTYLYAGDRRQSCVFRYFFTCKQGPANRPFAFESNIESNQKRSAKLTDTLFQSSKSNTFNSIYRGMITHRASEYILYH